MASRMAVFLSYLMVDATNEITEQPDLSRPVVSGNCIKVRWLQLPQGRWIDPEVFFKVIT